MALRIGGLASGMDTESIVKELMKAQNTKLDKFKQQKTKTEWKRDSYREFNTQLLDFRSKLTNMKLSTTFKSRTTVTSDDSRVTATATSAAGLGSFTMNSVSQLATAAFRTGASIKGTTAVSTSTSLYNNSTIVGTNSFTWKTGSVERKTFTGNGTNQLDLGITKDKLVVGEDLSVKVGSVSYKVVDSFSGSGNEVTLDNNGLLTFSSTIANGTSVSVNYAAKTAEDTIDIAAKATGFSLSKGSIDMSNAITLNVTLTPKEDQTAPPQLNRTLTITTDLASNSNQYKVMENGTQVGTFDAETGRVNLTNSGFGDYSATIKTSEYKQNYTSTSLTVDKNGVETSENFFFTGNTTLDQITSTINVSNLGVSMFFDSHTGQMTMTRKETGKSDIQFTGTNNNDVFKNLLGFTNITDTAQLEILNGQNAKFNLNGLETERTTNNFTINGVNFTLKKTFDADAGAVTVGVNNDVDTVVKNIKDFVDTYNKLVESMNSKITEKVNRSYAPPTDEEKESLSEKQLEDWVTQAKSGLLRNDSILSSTLSSMRMDFYGAVSNSSMNSVYNQLTQIGISTTANYLDGGKLEINETKLREALEADPEGVEALFTASGSASSSKGILNRLTDTVNGVMDRLREKAGNSYSTNQSFALGRELDSVTKQIERWQERLETIENRYWKQFTAMEKAIQNANSQSASLSNFFSQQ